MHRRFLIAIAATVLGVLDPMSLADGQVVVLSDCVGRTADIVN